MTAWTKVNASQVLPDDLVTAVASLGNALVGALESAEGKLNFASKIPSVPSIPDPVTSVVNAVLSTVSGLLKGGRIHVLPVPLAKTVTSPEASKLPSTLDDLQAMLDVTLGQLPAVAASAYETMVSRSGGNAGFYTAFAESLSDLADPNRPQYDNASDAVVMAVVLAGAPTLASASTVATALEKLIKPAGSAGSLTARTIPVPEDLRAKVVGAATGASAGVRLDWKAPATSFVLRFFPGVTVAVKRYAVIRSSNAKILEARSVSDLFGTRAIVEGLTVGDHVVLEVGSGQNAAYLDTSASAEKPNYYAIAWECEVRESGTTDTVPFGKLSNVVKLTAVAPSPAQTGSAPNWSATDSPIAAFPDFAKAAERMLAQASIMLTPPPDPTTRINAAMKLVTDGADRAATASRALITDIESLAAVLDGASTGLYVTRVAGTGGNARLLAELATRLGDLDDPTRPPFDNGEYVCGVCFVAGASRLADLASVVAFFDTLFGPASAANPLLGVLDAIDTLVTQAEADVFGPDMTPTTPTLPDGSVIDPVTGRPQTPSRPAIAEDGTAVETDDARNPEAGATHVTPIEELC